MKYLFQIFIIIIATNSVFCQTDTIDYINVRLINKKVYLKTDTLNPFSGIVVENNNFTKCYVNVKNGYIKSNFIVKYYQNGKLREKYSTLKDTSVKHGLFENWLENGNPISSGTYSKGKQIGFWEFYDDGKKIIKEIIPNVTKYENKSFIIKIAPITIVDPVFPSILIGVEKQLSRNVNIQTEFGYILPECILENYKFKSPDFKGGKVRVEAKYFYKHDKRNKFGPYVSLEIYFTNCNYVYPVGFELTIKDSSHYLTQIDDMPDYYDNISVSKKISGVNLKAGYQRNFKRFVIESYIGVGLKYNDIYISGRTNMNDYMFYDRINHDISENLIIQGKSMHRFLFNIPLNLKIGYLF
ncbi:MAG: hypothetical protein HY951_09005 [Bacteroidia bacterium]|nr:hypothetical protein [Bacteroidia bacterium]